MDLWCRDLFVSFEEVAVAVPEPRRDVSQGASVEEADLVPLVLFSDAQTIQEAPATVIEEEAAIVIQSPEVGVAHDTAVEETDSVPTPPSSTLRGDDIVALLEAKEVDVTVPAHKIDTSLDTPVEGSDAAPSTTPSEHGEPPISPIPAPEPAHESLAAQSESLVSNLVPSNPIKALQMLYCALFSKTGTTESTKETSSHLTVDNGDPLQAKEESVLSPEPGKFALYFPFCLISTQIIVSLQKTHPSLTPHKKIVSMPIPSTLPPL